MHVPRLRRAVVALAILAVPRPNLAAETAAPDPSPNGALYALRGLSQSGLSPAGLGAIFDAELERPALLLVPAAAPARPPVRRPLEEAPRRPAPFSIDVPSVPPPDYQHTFGRLLADRRAVDRFDSQLRRSARRFGLDPRLLKAIVAAESEFRPGAQSPAGARGLMQLMPATAEEMGIPRSALFDVEANLRAGALYLAHLFERAWKRYHLAGVAYDKAPAWLVQRVLAAYNAGPRFLARRRLGRAVRAYIRKVMLYYRSAVTEFRSNFPDSGI